MKEHKHTPCMFEDLPDEPHKPLPRDRTPFFTPVDIEDDPDVVAESTLLLDCLLMLAALGMGALVIYAGYRIIVLLYLLWAVLK